MASRDYRWHDNLIILNCGESSSPVAHLSQMVSSTYGSFSWNAVFPAPISGNFHFFNHSSHELQFPYRHALMERAFNIIFTSFQMRFYFFFNHFLFHLIFVLSSLFHPFDTTCKFLHCRPFKLGMLSAFEVEMLSFEVPTLRCFQGFVQIYKYKFKFKYKYIFALGFPASVAKISVLLLPRGN